MKENSFFAAIRRSGWTRGESRWISGVCSGIAQKTGWDVALVRGLVVVLSFFFWFLVALYGAAWLLLPDSRDGKILFEELIQGKFESVMIGAFGAIIIGFVGLGSFTKTWFFNPFSWFGMIATIAIIVAVIVIVASNKNTSPQNERSTFVPSNHQGTPSGPNPHMAPQAPHAPNPPRAPRAQPPGSGAPRGPQNYGGAPNNYQYQYQYQAPHAPTYAPQSSYQPPVPEWKVPKVSNAVGLTILGLLLIAAAGLLIAGVRWGGPVAHDSFAVASWCALALILFGAGLSWAALRGNRGGWLLGFSIVAAIFIFPAGLVASANFNEDGDLLGFAFYNWTTKQWSLGTTNIDRHGNAYVTANSETFDHEIASIEADASTVTLDLTDAPEDYNATYDIDLDASTIRVIVTEDQAMKLNVEGDFSDISQSPTNATDWIPANTGTFDVNAASPNFTGTGFRIDADLDASTMTIQVEKSE
jgi:Putative stress-responsive transcriptional regulator